LPARGPKYARPKILVADAPDVAAGLRERGYAAESGSFGQPVAFQDSAGYSPLNLSFDLPGFTEQEIIVADLAGPEPVPANRQAILPASGVPALWASKVGGLVDPRAAAMTRVQKDLDRIYRHGGVFIIFGAPRVDPNVILATLDRSGTLVPCDPSGALAGYAPRRMEADNWNLLSDLRWLQVRSDTGQEMDVADNGFARLLGIENYFKAGRFECVTEPMWSLTKRWVTLAVNKYGDPVAGVILPDLEEQEQTTGLIFVFPQVERRADLVIELVDRVLPSMAPRLFPDADGSRWTRLPEYDLPGIGELRNEINQVEGAARARVRELEEQIKAERSRFGFLHDLLTTTDDDLVQAVIRALEVIGFKDVRDADADAKSAGETGPLREDLRIMDAVVPVLVEVKGINGLPKEAQSLQVTKYLVPRMREWQRSDLRGLAIINHQRGLPGLERENEHVFQADVLASAEEQGFGLLTTWDLFRLVRGFLVHGWRHDDIAGLFVTAGRIRPIPAHYKFIGTVEEFWQQAGALGIRLQAALHVGDRVAYELPVDFIEEDATSLQMDKQDVDEAKDGDYVGVNTGLTKDQARKGVRVYLVTGRNPG
jgi:hypothetical protein